LYEDMGRREDARAEFKKEADLCKKRLSANPQDQASLIFLAVAHSGLEEYTEALAAIRKVLALDPRNGEAIYTRGLIFEKMGRFSEALRDFQTAKGFFLRHSFIEQDIARVKRGLSK
ncbi:MAG: tetratricopeptide repeat protein, partial [Candidatus Omnitrophota bacterium]